MSVGVQGETSAEVAENGRDGFHVHPVLQGQSGEGVAQIVEPHIGQPRPFQPTRRSIFRTLSGEMGPPLGDGTHTRCGFLLLASQHSQGLFSQGITR